MNLIRISTESVDGVRHRKVFKTLAGARRFAHDRVGERPEIGSTYAVAPDGIVVLYASGVTWGELFPALGPTEAEIEAAQDAAQDAYYRAEREAERAGWEAWELERYGPPEKAPEPIPEGTFQVVRIDPVYCQITDGLIGSNVGWRSTPYPTREAAEESVRRFRQDVFDESTYKVIAAGENPFTQGRLPPFEGTWVDDECPF